MIINNIFVYGTLVDGLLSGAFPGIDLHIKMGKSGKINARLFDIGEYPGAKPTTIPWKVVFGKIYEVDPEHFNEVLVALDDYEAFNPGKKEESLYIRKIIPVVMEDGCLSKAWIYWYNRPVNGRKEIEPGDYKKYLKRNKLKKKCP